MFETRDRTRVFTICIPVISCMCASSTARLSTHLTRPRALSSTRLVPSHALWKILTRMIGVMAFICCCTLTSCISASTAIVIATLGPWIFRGIRRLNFTYFFFFFAVRGFIIGVNRIRHASSLLFARPTNVFIAMFIKLNVAGRDFAKLTHFMTIRFLRFSVGGTCISVGFPCCITWRATVVSSMVCS